MITDLDCVVLASGFSRRFGCDKLLQPLPSGLTLIESTLSIYQSVFASVSVVVRENNSELRSLLNENGVSSIVNKKSAYGLSQSIVAAVNARCLSKGWLIALADMPLVQPETLNEIAALAQSENIVQPTYQGRSGNPVFIGQKFKSDLLKLEGDVGAKQLLSRSKKSLQTIACEDPGIVTDIDTESDFTAVFRNL